MDFASGDAEGGGSVRKAVKTFERPLHLCGRRLIDLIKIFLLFGIVHEVIQLKNILADPMDKLITAF